MSDTRRILVADDDLLIRMIANEALSQAGYQVVLAENGREALTALEVAAFDLLVTDILMPDIDGLELMREVSQRWPHTPIIAISSGGRLDSGYYLPLAHAMGAVAVMAKPLRPAEFLEAVEGVLNREERRIA